MRFSGILLVLVLLVGCAKNRPWPAAIVGVEGFSADQKAQLVDALSDLNKRLGHDVVLIQNTGSDGENYPVTVVLGTPADGTDSALAGVATVSEIDCTINISPKVFLPEHPDTFKPVIWHELGHCAGLLHDPTPGEIMYKSSTSFTRYHGDELTRFFKAVTQSAGLSFAIPTATSTPTPAI